MTQPMTPIIVEYYTDPLCCWSWAHEPRVRKLREEFGQQLQWRLVMGGIYPDPESSQRKDTLEQQQLAWQEAKQEQGMPFDLSIWDTAPPVYSIPACRMVKAAARQGQEQELALLRRFMEAVMTERNPLATLEQLLHPAREVHGLDCDRLAKDYQSPAILNELNEDFALTRSPIFHAEELVELTNGL